MRPGRTGTRTSSRPRPRAGATSAAWGGRAGRGNSSAPPGGLPEETRAGAGTGHVPAPPSLLLLQPPGHVFEYVLLVGELAGLELRVDQLALDRHLEAPAAGRHQRERLDLLLEPGEQLGRQTDGLRF